MSLEARLRFTDEERELQWICQEAERRGRPIPSDVVGSVLRLRTEFELLEGNSVIVTGPCGEQASVSIGDDGEAMPENLTCLLCMLARAMTPDQGDGSPDIPL